MSLYPVAGMEQLIGRVGDRDRRNTPERGDRFATVMPFHRRCHEEPSLISRSPFAAARDSDCTGEERSSGNPLHQPTALNPSPAMPLLGPRITMHMIPVTLPEPRLIPIE